MTREPTVEERISEWLHDEASGQLPDWVLAATFERTRADRQRRDTRRWRFPPMNTPMKIVLLTAIALAALVGIGLSAGQRPNLSQVAVHSPSACATLDDSAAPEATARAGTSPLGDASPVQFLWSATGGADGMSFSRDPNGVAIGGTIGIAPDCNIWVADNGRDRFAIFGPDGSFVGYWGTPGKGAGQFDLGRSTSSDTDGYGALAFAPDGSFYVLDVGNLRVQHFGEDRGFLGSWDGAGSGAGRFSDPIGLAVDANGTVHVLDDARNLVETYDKDGNFLRSFSPQLAGYNSANGLALDATGAVYVTACCTLPNQVWRFDPQGVRVSKTPSLPTYGFGDQLDGIAVDSSMRLFVTHGSSDGDKVRVYDAEGTLVASFGSYGSGDGQFGPGSPLGIALDGQGDIYITDGAQNRLEKFRLLPPLAP